MTSSCATSSEPASTPWGSSRRPIKRRSLRRSGVSRRPPAAPRFASVASVLFTAFVRHSERSMESDELKRVEQRARLAYETSRLRRAIIAFAPILLLVIAAALIGQRVRYTLALGTALFTFGVVLLWYGRDIRRAVLPGVQ